jgi:hypothetical protein
LLRNGFSLSRSSAGDELFLPLAREVGEGETQRGSAGRVRVAAESAMREP